MLFGCAPNEDTNTFESQQVIENPFLFEQLNVPFVTSMNRGRYSRLKSEEAHETINKVFREAGITFETNYQYKKNGLNIKLDGYDAKRKIQFFNDYFNDPKISSEEQEKIDSILTNSR